MLQLMMWQYIGLVNVLAVGALVLLSIQVYNGVPVLLSCTSIFTITVVPAEYLVIDVIPSTLTL